MEIMEIEDVRTGRPPHSYPQDLELVAIYYYPFFHLYTVHAIKKKTYIYIYI